MPISALELRWQLRQLQHKHDAAPVPHTITLLDPVREAVIFEGMAATCDLDLERMQLAPFAFGDPLPDCRHVPLLVRHDPGAVAGEIQNLSYDRHGNLRIRCRVEHAEARRMGAFSVGLKIIECELRDADSASFHGLLKRVELSECSITDRPANPYALIEQRTPAAISDFYSLMQLRVQCVAKYLQLVGQHCAAQVPT